MLSVEGEEGCLVRLPWSSADGGQQGAHSWLPPEKGTTSRTAEKHSGWHSHLPLTELQSSAHHPQRPQGVTEQPTATAHPQTPGLAHARPLDCTADGSGAR